MHLTQASLSPLWMVRTKYRMAPDVMVNWREWPRLSVIAAPCRLMVLLQLLLVWRPLLW